MKWPPRTSCSILSGSGPVEAMQLRTRGLRQLPEQLRRQAQPIGGFTHVRMGDRDGQGVGSVGLQFALQGQQDIVPARKILADVGVVGERSGVVNIGIEGQMLISAFAAFFGAALTGSLVIGVLVGLCAGMLLGGFLAGRGWDPEMVALAMTVGGGVGAYTLDGPWRIAANAAR